MRNSDVNYAADPYGYPPQKRRRHGLLGLGFTVVSIVAFSGIVLYAYSRGGQAGPDGGPPLLTADPSPTKIRPDQPGGMEVPHQDKLVYDRLAAKDSGRPEIEHLLPPPEQPLPRPVVAPQLPPPPAPLAAPTVANVPPPPPGATTTVPRATPDDTAPPTAQIAPPPPVMPSPVVAAVPPAPVRTPAPAARTAPPPPPPPRPTPAPAPQAAAKPNPPAPAPAAPTPAPAPAASSAGASTGGYRVQLASVRSEGEAQTEWKRLASRYGEALGGLSLHVAKADLGEKGTYYRVQGGSVDEARAKSICAQLKAQNVGCVIVRP